MFKELFKDKTVAVVGPSPHLYGLELGDKIDSYDIVCRLNEVRPVGLEKDYGSKADVLFWHLNNCDLEPEFMPLYNEDPEAFKKAKMLVYPRQHGDVNRRGCGNSTPKDNAAKFPEIPFYQVDTNKVVQWERRYNAHLTVGTLSLMMILECEFKDLFVCGFSFYQNDGPNWHKAHPTHSDKRGAGHIIQHDIACLRDNMRGRENISGDYFFKEVILDQR